MTKSLVVYFSASGNTRLMAKQIQEITHSDILELKEVDKYPTGYNNLLDIAKKQITNNEHPKLEEYDIDMSQYDMIYLGTPNWFSTVAPPVLTFLKENDLTNKIIAPFITHGGGGKAHAENDLLKSCKNCTVKPMLAIHGGDNPNKNDITEWLENL